MTAVAYIAEDGATAHAAAGSLVYAVIGSRVRAAAGSTIHAELGADVRAENGAMVLRASITPHPPTTRQTTLKEATAL